MKPGLSALSASTQAGLARAEVEDLAARLEQLLAIQEERRHGTPKSGDRAERELPSRPSKSASKNEASAKEALAAALRGVDHIQKVK